MYLYNLGLSMLPLHYLAIYWLLTLPSPSLSCYTVRWIPDLVGIHNVPSDVSRRRGKAGLAVDPMRRAMSGLAITHF